MTPESPSPAGPDRLTVLVETVLGQSRAVRTVLLDVVRPRLPPIGRGAAEHLVRRIDRGQLLDREALHDLEALLDRLERLVGQGTRQVWRPNECDPSHGHVEHVRDAAATALGAAVDELRLLHRGIAAVQDALEAQRIANRLAARA